MADFQRYRRKPNIINCRPWKEGDDMNGISINDVDREAGSPKVGDYIAQNPSNPLDMWLINSTYFTSHYEAE